MNPIAYYMTAHGYGHGTRSCDVLRALHKMAPEQPVIVTTDLPRDFLDSRLRGCSNITFRTGAFDVGLVQKDSLQSDLAQTLKKLATLYDHEEELLAKEQQFLEQNNAGLVVADIPAIPLAAAQKLGLPNLAIGNFSWDWIYEAYATENPTWDFFIQKFSSVYNQTDRLLRLPFAPSMAIFPNRTDIPLLASPGISQRKKMRILSTDKPWVLLSFTSLDLGFRALENIRALSNDYEFFCVEPLHYEASCIHSIRRNKVSFADILASCDIVISKPGFGLVSECIVNQKPLIYADRGDFAEYPYLVEGIEKYLKNIHLPSADLYAGNFLHALEKIQTAPEPKYTLPSGGAEMIARELLNDLIKRTRSL